MAPAEFHPRGRDNVADNLRVTRLTHFQDGDTTGEGGMHPSSGRERLEGVHLCTKMHTERGDRARCKTLSGARGRGSLQYCSACNGRGRGGSHSQNTNGHSCPRLR